MEQKQNTNELLRYRKAAGLRQLEIARALGLSSTDRICRWEKGRAFPNIDNLFMLCALYKALPHELYAELFKTMGDQVRSPASKELPALQESPLSGIAENANGTPKNGTHLTLSAEKWPMKDEKVLSPTSLESKSQKRTHPCQKQLPQM